MAKVEGEGILTRYQVFQVRDIITKSTYALADQLIVFSARGQLHRSLFTAVFGKGNSDFNHDINLSKDGRLVGNVKQAEMYNFNVMHGDYTIDFGQSYMYNIQVKPAQSLEFFPHVPKFTTQLHFEAVAFDETYKITDAEGYNVDTISRNKAYTGNLKSGAYEININGQQQSIVIDDMDSKRIWKMQNRDGGNAETGVSFTVLKAVKSDGLHVPVQLTVTAEDGTVIEKYREYTGATIKLPKPGRYTVSYENEGYYPQQQTFTYNSELELIKANVYIEEKLEQVTAELKNPTNINVATAQMELVNHKTNEILIGTNAQNSEKWTVSNVEPGTYTMRFKASGYVTFEREVNVYKSSQVTVPVYLTEYHSWYDRFEKFDDVKVVDATKKWQVKFSAPVNEKQLSTDTIYVTDGNGVRLNDVYQLIKRR